MKPLNARPMGCFMGIIVTSLSEISAAPEPAVHRTVAAVASVIEAIASDLLIVFPP